MENVFVHRHGKKLIKDFAKKKFFFMLGGVLAEKEEKTNIDLL